MLADPFDIRALLRQLLLEHRHRRLARLALTDAISSALEQLEQAKAELERVLRQLREEEMERTLTMLAARFRKGTAAR